MIATSVGSLLNPINSSMIAVALVTIGQVFHAGTSTTAWLVSVLYLATAVGQPTMGRMADRLGARRVYLGGLVLLAGGGVLGYWASSFGMLIGARVVIGVGTSAAYPAAVAMVRRQSERLSRPVPGGVLGALAVAGQVSAAVGPPLGAVLIAIGGWRSVFLVNLPLALIGTLLALAWLPTEERRRPAPAVKSAWNALDPAGLGLFVATMTALLVFLMRLSPPRWSILGVAGVLGGALVWWELRARKPFVDVRMLAANRALSTTYLRYALSYLGTYSFIYGWTQWLEQGDRLPASTAGLMLGSCFLVAAVVSMIGSRGRRTWGPLVLGSVTLTVGSGFLLFMHGGVPLWTVAAVSMFFGLPTGLNTVGGQAAMYAQAPADQVGTAAGLLRTFMYLGAILSASLISISFGQRATDTGLHSLATVLTTASVLLLVLTLLSPGLRVRRIPEPRRPVAPPPVRVTDGRRVPRRAGRRRPVAEPTAAAATLNPEHG